MKSKMRWEGENMCDALCFMNNCAGGCQFCLERKKIKQICRQIANNETLPIFNAEFNGNKYLSENNCCVDEIGCFLSEFSKILTALNFDSCLLFYDERYERAQ